MKNRFVPIYLFTTFFGLSLLLCSVISLAGQPGNPDTRKSDGSRWERIRANQHTGVVNPLDVINARQQATDLHLKSASNLGLNWYNAGPDNYPGLIWSTIFDKTDPAGLTVLAGSEAGGVWKSINLGLSWTPMPVQDNRIIKASSLVQSGNGTVYAATGIVNCEGVGLAGNGIYKSSNGGTFEVIPATALNPDFSGVTKLAINPQTDRLFAATIGGLYFSDNGTEWTRIKSGYAKNVCVGSDGTVIAAIDDSAYLTTDASLASWVTLTTGKPNELPNTDIGWMVFAIAPSDANIMYASVAAIDGDLLNVYCSTDHGTTWSVIFPNNPMYEPFATSGCYANTLVVFPGDPDKIYLGGVNMWYGRRVQPTGYFNWEEVSFGAYSPWLPNSAPAFHHDYMFSPVNSNKMAMATDGGLCIATIGETVEYQTSNKNLASSQFYALSFSVKRDFVMGGGRNIGSLALGYFYPTFTSSPNDGFPLLLPDGLVIGTDGGTCAWSNLDYNVGIFSSQATATILRQDFRDLTYVNDFMNGLTSVYTDYSPMNLWESFTFTQTQDSVKAYAREKAIPADTLLQVKSANGINFPYLTTAPIPLGDSIVVADPIASRFFYYAKKADTNYRTGIFMTKDMLKFYKSPEYFIVFKDTATKVDFVSTIAVSSDLNTLWAGTQRGRLIRVTGLINANDSATANAFSSQCVLVNDVFTNTPFNARHITSISINPADGNQMLITLGNYGNQDYVYFTSNANAAVPTFTSVQSNLPKTPVYTGLIELHGNNALVGTDFGVFSTANLTAGAPVWDADIQNIGDVPVRDIRQQTMYDYHVQNYGVIYLASYGRGLWFDTTYYSPVGIEPVIGNSGQDVRLNLTPNPVKDIVTISYVNSKAGDLTLRVYDLTGRIVMSTLLNNQPKGTVSTNLNLSGLSQGTYLVKLGNGQGKIVKL